ncbi:SpoIIE family protein phosphatase [Streptomyces sp. NPDC050625]|uniref:SpoIIE family protein phosphatase n=1 Tax=Streptomyces sp. NPDC050625 TaxID=3154629 RepID=UPI00342F8A65
MTNDPSVHQDPRLEYLESATRRIARGMDIDETLHELGRAAVPAFADRAYVFMCDPLPVGDEAQDVALVLRLHDMACSPGAAPGAGRRPAPALVPAGPAVLPGASARLAKLLRAGQPVFGDFCATAAVLKELLEAASATDPPPGRRSIIAPLHGRAHALGGVVLIREAVREAFDGDDLLVAAQLATHTALGIDKAVLHGREASVADALQRMMLPAALPKLTGVRLASRYLAASRTAQVGGDWYDAIPLPGNRVALVIGDVMGHSVTSAAIMGQLRTVVQTLAGLDLPPEEVLYHLDEQAERLGEQHLATCLYIMYDPVLRRLLIANAGHPPPVLVHPDGSAEVMDIPAGVPIGVGGGVFECVETSAPAGATLLLYTDGLVETRGSDVQKGLERLLQRLKGCVAPLAAGLSELETLCDEALGVLEDGVQDDDIALLAARLEGVRPETFANWYLAPHPRTAGQARRLIRRTLLRWALGPLLETTELLVSEVVGNAVRFANRPIGLRVLRTDVLRCEVADDSAQVPRMRHARPSDENGRGLWLVDQLADRWGATRVSTGKIVWFEQALPELYQR